MKKHPKTPRRHRAESAKLQITITRKTERFLEKIVGTGFYGTNVATAAERLICDQLRSLLKDGLIKRAAELEK